MGGWLRTSLAMAVAVVGVLALGPPAAAAPAQGLTPEELEPLLTALHAEGFAREDLNRIFLDQRLQKIDRVVTFNVFNPDSADIYEQFLSPFAIKLAKGFRNRHLTELKQVEARFGVWKEVIVAILLVETQFGTAALRYRPLEVFTTLIVDASPAAVERHYQRLKPAYPQLERAFLEERLRKKAQWAYGELVALLSMHDLQRVDDLYNIKGSYAGAFGWPQFLPSSYLSWAVDGNRDRRIDLDNPSDAMASIANFLKVHGWRRNAPAEDNMRAVWEYNHSTHYVRTIFSVARMTVKAARKPKPPPSTPPAEEFRPVTQAATGAAPEVAAVATIPVRDDGQPASPR